VRLVVVVVGLQRRLFMLIGAAAQDSALSLAMDAQAARLHKLGVDP
jgi:hypothetical protein